MIAFITHTMQIARWMLAMVAVMPPPCRCVAADRIDEVIRTAATIHDPTADAKAAKEHKERPRREPASRCRQRRTGAHRFLLQKSARPLPSSVPLAAAKSKFLVSTDPLLLRRDRRQRDRGRHRRAPCLQIALPLAGAKCPKGVLSKCTIDSNPEVRRGPPPRCAVKRLPPSHRPPVIGRKAGGLRKAPSPAVPTCLRPNSALVHRPCHVGDPKIYLFDEMFLGSGITRPTWPCAAPPKACTDNATVLIVAQRIPPCSTQTVSRLDEGRLRDEAQLRGQLPGVS